MCATMRVSPRPSATTPAGLFEEICESIAHDPVWQAEKSVLESIDSAMYVSTALAECLPLDTTLDVIDRLQCSLSKSSAYVSRVAPQLAVIRTEPATVGEFSAITAHHLAIELARQVLRAIWAAVDRRGWARSAFDVSARPCWSVPGRFAATFQETIISTRQDFLEFKKNLRPDQKLLVAP